MELANCWVVLDKFGSEVPKRNVTPAELILLVNDRKAVLGRHPIHDLVVIGSLDRPSKVERERLVYKYGKARDSKESKVAVLFPGATTALPETFKETGLLDESVVKKLDVEVKGPDESKMPEIVETYTPEGMVVAKATEPTKTVGSVASTK